MSDNVTVRVCTVSDIETLVRLGIQTFRETFDAVNTVENMKLYLEKTFTVEKIRNEFKEPGAVFFMAEHQNIPLGFAKVRTSKNEPGLNGTSPLEIERLYAAKDHIGKGIGKMLMQTCIDQARKSGCDVVWLGVWEHNVRAIEFYRKSGFTKFGQHTFMLGTDAQTDFLLQRKLN